MLSGSAVGKVVTGEAGGFVPGDYVLSMSGWREWFVSNGEGLRKIEPDGVPVESWLGVLGMPGLTAYAGLKRIGELKEDDRVLVSAAAGAVGSVACQIARNIGARVAGITGGPGKCGWLRDELGISAIDYRAAPDLAAAIADTLPEGVDLYFDNVGGSHLAAALANMRTHGRIIACGMIEQYNAEAPRGPANFINIIGRRLRMQGLIVSDHIDLIETFEREMKDWIREGRMISRETVADGIENAPRALIGLFSGENLGKMLVRLGGDE